MISTAKNHMKISIPGVKVSEAIITNDGGCTLVIDPEDIFVKISPSEIIKDNHVAFWLGEKENADFRAELEEALATTEDFYCHRISPCDYMDRFNYCFGCEPAIGHNLTWWWGKAEKYIPGRGSRLGTKKEYLVFLAFLANEMIKKGINSFDAWQLLRNKSYLIANIGISGGQLECTGNREHCGFFDLGNTFKIIQEEKHSCNFLIAGGAFNDSNAQIAYFLNYPCNIEAYNNLHGMYHTIPLYSTGWVVLEK